MLRRALLGWGVLVLVTALGSCGGGSPAAPSDGGPIPCTDDNQCPAGYNCSGGYCQTSTHPEAGADAPPPAKMLVSPTVLDFGSPYVGGEYVKTFTIANVGVADLTVASLNLIEDRTNGAFQLTAQPTPFVIAGGDQATVTVTLRPNDQNLPTGSVKIHSDDPDSSTADQTVDLVTHIKGSAALGVCVENPAPPPDCVISPDQNPLIDYGAVDYGTSAERVVALTNVGDGNLPVEITGVSMTSTAHFSLTLFALVDDPAHPGTKIEQATTLPFFLSIGDAAATPPVPATQLRVHVKFEAVGIDGDIPHESVVVEYSLTGSPTTIPIVGHINGCKPNGSDAGVPDGGMDPQTDPYNCGACGVRCDTTVLHATPTCTAGECGYSTCETNWGDCDVDYTNGCETDLRTTLAHCGACDSPCTNTHGTGSVCSGSACTAPSCDTYWGNCDGDNKNGCETDLRVTTDHCGTCNTACTTPPGNGTTRCLSSMCVPTCVPNRSKDCDGDPVNGCETNIGTDVNNCGDCHVVCDSSGGSTSCVGGVCKPGCSQGFGDCDGNPTNGCETNILTNPDDCGGCGASYKCSNNNMSTRTCTNGQCSGACATSFLDCNNNKQSDGCEVNGQSDPDNCGGCTIVCSANNMQSRTCVAGVCSGLCVPGFADCNGNKRTDGCEINTQTDNDNCGGCGKQCSGANIVSRICAGGQCTGACVGGFADCNGDKLTDGCETDIAGNPDHCGGCSTACSNNHMLTRTCASGSCNGQCASGYADCNSNKQSDGCETPTTTILNCGGCGAACDTQHSTGVGCDGTKCTYGGCASGWTDCNTTVPDLDGCETNTGADPDHCGGCSTVCSSSHMQTRTCGNGMCNGQCAAGYADCNSDKQSDGCETPTNTTSNCAGCGNVCDTLHSTGAGCNGTTCTYTGCVSGWTDCTTTAPDTNGCDTNTAADPDHCGGCSTVCSSNHMQTRTCASGQCNGQCASGYADCNTNKQTDGCETPTNTTSNCGGCGNACDTVHSTGAACNGTSCTYGGCVAGWTNCNTTAPDTNGCETNTAADPDHCGGCSTVCSSNNMQTRTCASNTCNGQCAAGFADCNGNKQTDGCETPITTASNCGGCGVACDTLHSTGAACSGGTCTYTGCATGYADCDTATPNTNGCETHTDVDLNNCGGCGYKCADHVGANVTGYTCTAGACVITSCTAGYYDIDGTFTTGCECQEDSVPNVCSGAVSLGNVAVNGTVNSPAGRNLTPAGDEDWYSVTFLTDGTCNFNPKISLSAGVLPIAIQVFYNCSNGAMNCKAAEGGTSSKALLVTWEMEYQATCGDKLVGGVDPTPDVPPFISNTPPSGLPAALTFYIRVYPTGSSPTCLPYTITATN